MTQTGTTTKDVHALQPKNYISRYTPWQKIQMYKRHVQHFYGSIVCASIKKKSNFFIKRQKND